MDKFKILIILIIVFIFAEGAGLIYFANKSQQIKKARPKIEEISAEKQELERRYEEVSLKYKVVERDRNNLLIQTKRLIA